LKRVNALAGLNGKLYHDNIGWYVIWKSDCRFEESAMNAGELLAYLHGIEDAYLFISNKEGKL
jgi:hypothetical protein